MTAVSRLSKATSQQLLNWSTFLGQFLYTIQHISGNLWGDLISRWVTVPVAPWSMLVMDALSDVPAAADLAPPRIGRNANDLWTVRHTKEVRLQHLPDVVGCAIPGYPESFAHPSGRLVLRASTGRYKMSPNGVLWIPDAADEQQLRLLVCSHCRKAGHRGRAATLARLTPLCWWSTLEQDVAGFINSCLNWVDSRISEKLPRPFGETTHGTEVGACLHFDHLYVGDSVACGGAEDLQRDGAVDVPYIFVMKEDLTGLVMHELAAAIFLNMPPSPYSVSAPPWACRRCLSVTPRGTSRATCWPTWRRSLGSIVGLVWRIFPGPTAPSNLS